MLVTCPSCSHGFDIIEATQGGRATVVCPSCARVIVIKSADNHPDEGTQPFDSGTMATIEEATDLAGGRFTLAFPKGKRVSLAVVTGPRKGEAIHFASPKVLIGRAGGGGGAELELDDPDVSRKHATVECHGERIILRDLNSTNGTYVGTERIQSRELKENDEFRVGHSRLMLVIAPE
jgi:hypothetical protein